MSRPLPDPVFFLDHSLGTTEVAIALRAAGSRVEILLDHFASDAPDETWLVEVGSRGWVVLTKDQRIRRRHVEISALRAANVAAFVLTAGDLKGSEMAAAFVKAIPRIEKALRDHESLFVAGVSPAGDVTLLTQSARRGARKQD